LPANTFGRHCSIELYWQSQYTVLLSTVITAHQGACAVAGGGPKNTPARAAMAAKINRVIVSLHARCPNNTERLPVFAANIISRRRNVLPPKADISRRNRQCPLWAKSEHRLRELIEKIEDRRYGPRISRSKSATGVRVSLVPTFGNSVYQFAEVATKLSIKDVFNAFRALTH